MNSVSRFAATALIAVVVGHPSNGEAQLRPGMGGNVGETRTAGAAYRAHVRNIIGQLTADLAEAWDGADAGKSASFYDSNAAVILGTAGTFEGRDAIRKAFEGKLRKMRGMIFTLEGFDMSDELAFARGTMSYEIIRADEAPKREIMAFTMSLRLKRGDWIIQSHSIGGDPVLPD